MVASKCFKELYGKGNSSWPSVEDFAKLGTSILLAKSPGLLQQFEIVVVGFGTASIWCKTPNFSCFRLVFGGCRCPTLCKSCPARSHCVLTRQNSVGEIC
jgi:hypothetical protein